MASILREGRNPESTHEPDRQLFEIYHSMFLSTFFSSADRSLLPIESPDIHSNSTGIHIYMDHQDGYVQVALRELPHTPGSKQIPIEVAIIDTGKVCPGRADMRHTPLLELNERVFLNFRAYRGTF